MPFGVDKCNQFRHLGATTNFFAIFKVKYVCWIDKYIQFFSRPIGRNHFYLFDPKTIFHLDVEATFFDSFKQLVIGQNILDPNSKK